MKALLALEVVIYEDYPPALEPLSPLRVLVRVVEEGLEVLHERFDVDIGSLVYGLLCDLVDLPGAFPVELRVAGRRRQRERGLLHLVSDLELESVDPDEEMLVPLDARSHQLRVLRLAGRREAEELVGAYRDKI